MRMMMGLIVRGVAAGALLMFISMAGAQTLSYPNRPIHVVVPFPPGGAVDPIARSIAQPLQDAWGQPIVIDNKGGASTIIGTAFTAKAPADGYTVILAATSFAVNPAMYSKLPYDPVRDFVPISLLVRIPNMLVVNPQLPVGSLRELIDYLKARPGQVNFSSIGNGTTQHLAAELFKTMAGVNIVHVPYKGSGPSMMSVVSGETSMTFESMYLLLPQVKAGKLRAIAASGTRRSPLLPDLATISESGVPGFELAGWVGFLAPAGTSREIVQKWQSEIARVLQIPEFRERMIGQGLEPVGSTPEYFAEVIGTEIAKWRKVAKDASIKLD